MSSKFWEELSNDYEKLFETKIGYDVIIYAGEDPDVKEIHAHSNILCIRSQYFRAAFANEWAEKKGGKFILRKPNFSPQIFNIILRFIYCGNIELKNLQGPDVLKLLIAVDELNIQPLISHIQKFLIEYQTDPIEVLEFIYQHETFEDLLDLCLEKICEDPKILFNSDKFINLRAPLLELLLKRDDLNANEIDIWENVLKWCITQQNMENDPTIWSKKDFINIERSLHGFVPLIRFNNIESKDFFCKVYCYKDILPRDLIHDLLKFHTDPDMIHKTIIAPLRKPKFLIELNHILLFASWIDRKDPFYYNEKNIPYDFKLLYRSNQDGLDSESFHRKCDNKGATIWVAKIQGSTQLIGGYNPLDWNGDCVWKYTTDSFLFNFTDRKNIHTAKLGYVKRANNAIYCIDNQGPHMGYIYCPGDSNNWRNSDNNADIYPDIGIPAKFKIENYEVFQVTS